MASRTAASSRVTSSPVTSRRSPSAQRFQLIDGVALVAGLRSRRRRATIAEHPFDAEDLALHDCAPVIPNEEFLSRPPLTPGCGAK
jgi:hypothetical protein